MQPHISNSFTDIILRITYHFNKLYTSYVYPQLDVHTSCYVRQHIVLATETATPCDSTQYISLLYNY